MLPFPRGHLSGVCALALAAMALGGCRQVLENDVELPPFPPTEFEPEVTTTSGLILRATSEVLSENPTVLRITATVENPTDEEILNRSLVPECRLIIAGFWKQRPDGRLLQPLDGYFERQGFTLNCDSGGMAQFYRIPAGETIDLSRGEDLAVSEVLGDTFRPGRHFFTVVFVDDFIYQALAGDLVIDD